MENSKFVLVVGHGPGYYRPFRKYGEYTADLSILRTPEKVALVVFTGGSDISSSIYGHRPCHLTSCFAARDLYEMTAFKRAGNLPKAGICRGAQLLCALAGGTLMQHITGHEYGDHRARTHDDRLFDVSSTHHQMMVPPKDAKALLWSDPVLSTIYLGENGEEQKQPKYELEAAYFPNINAVGCQYHPECMPESSEGFLFCQEVVEEYLLD